MIVGNGGFSFCSSGRQAPEFISNVFLSRELNPQQNAAKIFIPSFVLQQLAARQAESSLTLLREKIYR